MPKVHLLDYAAGNIRSLVNAIEKVGWDVEWIKSPEEVANAEVRPMLFTISALWPQTNGTCNSRSSYYQA